MSGRRRLSKEDDGDDDNEGVVEELRQMSIVQSPSETEKPSSSEILFFDLLPEEVLVHILGFVDFADPSNFALLSFNDLFRRCGSFSITQLSLRSEEEMPTSMARELLELSPRLRNLTMWRRRRSSDSCELAILAVEKCPDLRESGYPNIPRDQQAAPTMTRVMMEALWRYGKRIQDISITGPDFTTCFKPAEKPAWNQLSKLYLEHCHGAIEGRLFKMIGECCPRLENLTIMTYDDDWRDRSSSEEGECEFIQSVKDTIQHMYLSIDGSMTRGFFRDVGQCRKLHTLQVHFANDLDRQGMLSIASLPRLKCLRLPEANLLKTKDYIDAFGKKKLVRLTELDLQRNDNLNDDALEVIAKNCPNLNDLNLQTCREMTDVGLSAVMKNCLKMKQLYLEFT